MPIQDQPLSSKQHAVPQNIMDVEFRLIGELTMRQFVYILVFAIAAYMAKLSVPQPFTWFFVTGLGLIGLGFAFVPYEDRGLDEWVVNFIKAINMPTERIWKKRGKIPVGLAYEQNLRFVQQELITLAPTASRRKLEEYLGQQGETEKVDALDIPEEMYINMVKKAFKKERSDAVQSAKPHPEEIKKQINEPKKIEGKEITVEKEKEKNIESKRKERPEIAKQTKINKIVETRIKKSKIKLLDEGKSRRERPLQPLAEHSGRKFVNLIPSRGQIVLPIRGEKVIQIAEERDKTLEEKSRRMRALLEKTREENKREKKLSVRQIPSMVKKPNTVSGIIKNRKGEYIEGVILVIKNEKGEPIRALKTDRVGRFLVSTPLANGKYEIEIDGDKQTNLAFDIIPLEVKGALLPSFEITGR